MVLIIRSNRSEHFSIANPPVPSLDMLVTTGPATLAHPPSKINTALRGAPGKTTIVDPYEEGAVASSLVIIRPINPIYIYNR